jgi:hypothetical protein
MDLKSSFCTLQASQSTNEHDSSVQSRPIVGAPSWATNPQSKPNFLYFQSLNHAWATMTFKLSHEVDSNLVSV